MKISNSEIEKYRVKAGLMKSDASFGNNGVFLVPNKNVVLVCIASDGGKWEHVSVEAKQHPLSKPRVPTWEEMQIVKGLFWNDDEVVVQYHPAKSDYVNVHEYVLHLWKPVGEKIPVPPIWMV